MIRTNGMILIITDCGWARAPSHHVPMPMSWLVFQTAANAKNDAVHAAPSSICQPVVTCPGRCWIGWGAVKPGIGGGRPGRESVVFVSSATQLTVGAAALTSPAATLLPA